jgi:hypothetical protein
MKVYWRSGGIAPRILDLGTRWRWVVGFMPQLLYPQGKSPWHPLDRRLGGPQSWSGHGGEEKNSQPVPGLAPPTIQPIAQPYIIELSWLPALFCCGENSLIIYKTSFSLKLLATHQTISCTFPFNQHQDTLSPWLIWQCKMYFSIIMCLPWVLDSDCEYQHVKRNMLLCAGHLAFNITVWYNYEE